MVGPVVDGVDELVDGFERGPAETAVGDLAEPELDQVEPAARGRGEVQVDSAVAGQPGPDVGVLLGVRLLVVRVLAWIGP